MAAMETTPVSTCSKPESRYKHNVFGKCIKSATVSVLGFHLKKKSQHDNLHSQNHTIVYSIISSFNMAAVSKIMTVVLRIAQIICAISIIGIASNYIATHKSRSLGHLSRFIFADVVAVISTFFAVIWLIPFSSNYMNWYIDALLGVFSAAMAGWLVYVS